MQSRAFLREVASARLPHVDFDDPVVRDAEIVKLPESVQRYLRFMNVVGRPRVWSFRCEWEGRFRKSHDEEWKRCEAWQYNTRFDVSRIFRIRVHLAPLVPIVAHDTYLRGHGRMLIKAYDLVPVENATGEELDIGELVTYLDDAILLAPSMLLTPAVRWTELDESTFKVALTDRARTVSGRVTLDERGAPLEFCTTDRFYRPASGGPWRRTRWTTPIDSWLATEASPLPVGTRATWHPPEGAFTYLEAQVVPGSVVYNVRPGE